MAAIVRRTIAYLLVLALLVSLTPVPAARAEETEPPETFPQETTLPQGTETFATEETGETETEAQTLPSETEEIAVTVPETEPVVETQPQMLFSQEIPDDFVAPFARHPGGLSGVGGLPAAYDSRDSGVVTSVKDQTPWQLCWAFSALAVGESYLISSGQSGSGIDLSERHLGYYFHGDACDPLGNAAGDGTYLAEDYLTSGNNNKFTTFALANWVGGASESRYPYDAEISGISRENAMDDIVHLTNAYWINARDTDSIKRYVMGNGSVGLSVYYLNSFYNPDTGGYYNDRYTATNHAISVVGWDDDYSADKFLNPPERDGAWLCKNSVGTEFGQEGYFWLSYCDAAISHSSATAFVFEFGPGANYQWNYHYDGGFGTSVRSVPSGGAVASVFTASGSDAGADEQIRAVGIATADADVSYSIQIYRDPVDPTDPTSGTPALSRPQTGKTGLCGYRTIGLEEPVTVRSGETFAVVVTLRSDTGLPVRYFVDESYVNGSWIRFVSRTEAGQSYAANSSGVWADLAEEGYAARLKAFTVELSSRTVSALKFEQESVLLTPGETFRQTPVKEPENADDCPFAWHSDNESVVQVFDDGTVTAVDHGEAVITVTALEGRVSASFRVTVKPRIQSIYFLKTRPVMVEGEKFTPVAEILPSFAAAYYTLALSSSDETVAKIEGDSVLALQPGNAVITVSAGISEVSYTVTVTRSIAGAQVSAEPADYTGSPAESAVTVTLNGEVLEKDRDYTLSFANNTVPGIGTVTVTGIGLYSGRITAEFSIAVPTVRLLSVENREKGICLSWEAIPGVSGYHLYRSKDGGSWKKFRTLNTWQTDTCVDTGTSVGGAFYEYRICAYVKRGNTVYDGTSSENLGQCRLAMPQIRKLTLQESGVKVTWNKVPGADGYQVLRSMDAEAPEVIAQIDGNILEFLDQTLPEAGRLYAYSVLAVKRTTEGSDCSARSGERFVCIPEAPVLFAPVNGSRGVELRWEPVDHADGYEVFRSTNGLQWTRVKALTGADVVSWTDTSRPSGSNCIYQVKALVKLDSVTYRGAESQSAQITRLSAPVIRKLTAEGQGFAVTWNRVPGADSYRLFRSSGGELVEVGRTAALQLTDPSAETGTLYTYSVIAETDAGYGSAMSNGKSICDPAAPVLRTPVNGSRGVELYWEPVDHAVGYEIFRSSKGLQWSKVKTLTGAGAVSWTDTSRPSGSNCIYRVKALVKLDGVTYRGAESQSVQITRLSAPVIRKLTAEGQGFAVTWNRVPGADSYRLFRSNGGELVEVGRTTALQLTDPSAETGTLYIYSVIAETETGYGSAMSNGKSICDPAAPVLYPPEKTAYGTLLKWDPVALAAGYEIYRSSDGVRWSKVRTLNSGDMTSWTDTSRRTAPYYYRVVTVVKTDAGTCRSAPSGEVRLQQ